MVKQKNKNLFIDTNIWLSMYDSSPNNLNQFKKLLNLLDSEFNLNNPTSLWWICEK